LGDRPVYRTRLIWTEKVVWASFVDQPVTIPRILRAFHSSNRLKNETYSAIRPEKNPECE
jgi:hypothetical protein